MSMTPATIRRWTWLHKWSSLPCTIFMLLLCLTGLPLIFHHEIDHLLGNSIEAPFMPADTAKADLDEVIASALKVYPGKIMLYMSQERGDDSKWNMTVGDYATDEKYKSIAVDSRTAKVLAEAPTSGTFLSVMFRLHVDLFAGLPGMLFLGLMGFLLLLALVSGTVLYAPFMRKLDFGTVRHERAPRLKWLDLHNMLGIVTLVWVFVVGGTGMINTWADLLLKYWKVTEMAEMTAPYKGLPVPAKLASVQQSSERARAIEPGMQIAFIAFPGTAFSSPHHYGVFMRGNEAFTSRLYQPVLVNARTAQVTDSRRLPWYLTGLLLSQPLHFGDYGGRWMQILWALMDITTIIVLGSGVYLWLTRASQVNVALRAAGKTAVSAHTPSTREGVLR
jgi:uncharacterized iron-regulated membrane protein